jgi:hypothetical protein
VSVNLRADLDAIRTRACSFSYANPPDSAQTREDIFALLEDIAVLKAALKHEESVRAELEKRLLNSNRIFGKNP